MRNYDLCESAWKAVQLLDKRTVQKENLTTQIIRDYVVVTAENNKLRAELRYVAIGRHNSDPKHIAESFSKCDLEDCQRVQRLLA